MIVDMPESDQPDPCHEGHRITDDLTVRRSSADGYARLFCSRGLNGTTYEKLPDWHVVYVCEDCGRGFVMFDGFMNRTLLRSETRRERRRRQRDGRIRPLGVPSKPPPADAAKSQPPDLESCGD